MQNHASTLAAEFKLDAARVAATVALIDEGNTIPFIARYRKEATGSMDDQTLRALDERLSYLRKLDDQKETVHNSITEQGAMTPEIAAALEESRGAAKMELARVQYRDPDFADALCAFSPNEDYQLKALYDITEIYDLWIAGRGK